MLLVDGWQIVCIIYTVVLFYNHIGYYLLKLLP